MSSRRFAAGCGLVISSRIVARPQRVAEGAVALDDLGTVIGAGLLQDLVQLAQAVMRDGGE